MEDSKYSHGVRIISCFYQFERSAIIAGEIKFSKIDNSEEVFINKLISNQSLSFEKFLLQIKNERKYGDRIAIHTHPNLELALKKVYTSSQALSIYDFEDELNGSKNRLASTTDYWKSLKHDGRLTENEEIFTNLHHIKMAYLCFIQSCFDINLNGQNTIWWYSNQAYQAVY